jgi:hypothetical protein
MSTAALPPIGLVRSDDPERSQIGPIRRRHGRGARAKSPKGDRGVGLALDGFGGARRLQHRVLLTLTHLRTLPVGHVKLDRSFVTGMGREPADAAIVHATIALARMLTLRTVTEGVEDGPRGRRSKDWAGTGSRAMRWAGRWSPATSSACCARALRRARNLRWNLPQIRALPSADAVTIRARTAEFPHRSIPFERRKRGTQVAGANRLA